MTSEEAEAAVEQSHAECVEATLQFYEDMGAVMSLPKSLTMATTAELRRRARARRWGRGRMAIPVTCHSRDLGAHVSLGRQAATNTCAVRAKEAIQKAVVASKMPLSQDQLEEVLALGVMAKALYATEATPMAGGVLGRLRAVTADAVVRGAARNRSATMALATAGRELDPIVLLLGRRGVAVRRALVRRPELVEVAKGIIERYALEGFPGTRPRATGEEDPARRAAWAPECKAQGPLGLLLVAVWRAGGWTDSRLRIHADGEPEPLSILEAPCQQLRPRLYELARRGLARHLAARRPEARTSEVPMLRCWRPRRPDGEDAQRASAARKIQCLGVLTGRAAKHFRDGVHRPMPMV